MNLLKNDERFDDLQINGGKIIQNSNLYSFSNDPILLTNFSRIKKNATVVDLCSGSGIIGLLVALKSDAKKIYCIEYQQVLAEMSERSVLANNLQNRVFIINDKIQNYKKYLQKSSIDVVYCNPPYFKISNEVMCNSDVKTIARHEVEVTLSDVIKTASELLNSKGEFYLVHRTERIQEICFLCSKFNFGIKRISFVKSRENASPHLILLQAIKDANCETKFDCDVVLNNPNGSFTKQVNKLYDCKSILK